MAWIEYHQDLWNLWKIEHLAKRLEITYAHALGLVSCLWTWAIANAKDGVLKSFTDEEVAAACRWSGNHQGNFKRLLQDCELIDKETELIHDWREHGLRLLMQSREKQQRYRDSKKSKKSKRGRR